MQSYTVECPFCFQEVEVVETTTDERRRAGLAYLRLKCLRCVSTIESVGEGYAAAVKDMGARLAERRGTRKEQWMIRPVQRGRRRRK